MQPKNHKHEPIPQSHRKPRLYFINKHYFMKVVYKVARSQNENLHNCMYTDRQQKEVIVKHRTNSDANDIVTNTNIELIQKSIRATNKMCSELKCLGLCLLRTNIHTSTM